MEGSVAGPVGVLGLPGVVLLGPIAGPFIELPGSMPGCMPFCELVDAPFE